MMNYIRIATIGLAGCLAAHSALAADLEPVTGAFNYRLIAHMEGHSYWTTSIVFHPRHENIVVTSGGDSLVKMIDIAEQRVLWTAERQHNSGSYNLPAKFSPDGQWVVNSDRRGEIYFFAAQSGELLRTFVVPDAVAYWPVIAIEFSKDGRVVYLGRNGRIDAYSTETFELLKTFTNGRGLTFDGVFVDQLNRIVGHSASDVVIWDSDMPSEHALSFDVSSERPVGHVPEARHAQGRYIFRTEGSSVGIVDVIAATYLRTCHHHIDHVFDVAPSLDGRILISASVDGTMQVVESATCRTLTSYAMVDSRGSSALAMSVNASPSAEYIVLGLRGELAIFQRQ